MPKVLDYIYPSPSLLPLILTQGNKKERRNLFLSRLVLLIIAFNRGSGAVNTIQFVLAGREHSIFFYSLNRFKEEL
jgi:hypothetical protein